jgi:hypothetical protein
MKCITRTQVEASVPSRISVRLKDGEYRVNFRGGSEATAYYTTDAKDAIYTAWAMVYPRVEKFA